ncbi:SLAP domain-containing protein [Companilactobacillus sp. HBUAS59544]|uniref:SLAP domain-containing protein n=1 Tax=Companilactobacillus sp. HBUAS59544 TaxID=3109363 RepID=UPI002FF3E2D7
MDKRVKYVGIAAATLLAVAPIAAPVMTVSAADNNADTTVNADAKSTEESNSSVDTTKDASETTDTDSSATTDSEKDGTESDTNNEVDTDTKDTTETNESNEVADGVYKTSYTKGYSQDHTDEDGQPINYLTGTFPVMLGNKQIQISYDELGFVGNTLYEGEYVALPYIQGYKSDQEYIKINVVRDPKTNKPTGITLPGGVPTYTKNDSSTSTSTENLEAYPVDPIYSDKKGQESLPNSSNITAEQKTHAQKWINDMKDSIVLSKDDFLTMDDYHTIYIVGSDGWFHMPTNALTPKSDFYGEFGDSTKFFMKFNNTNDPFFDNDHYEVFATATANDGNLTRNLSAAEIDTLILQKGGQGVTFHFGIHYQENPVKGNGTWNYYLEGKSKQIAKKDVVVLPAGSKATNIKTEGSTGTTVADNTNTGSSTGTTTNTNNNTNTNTKPTTDNNKNETTETNKDEHKTTPAVEHHAVYATISSTKLYTADGKLITNRQLSANSTWRVDQEKTIDGETYYRVATNEWVKEEKGLEVNVINSVIETKNDAALYDSQGKKITNRILASNSAWRTDRTATINNQLMYRVATDEWIAARDIK